MNSKALRKPKQYMIISHGVPGYQDHIRWSPTARIKVGIYVLILVLRKGRVVWYDKQRKFSESQALKLVHQYWRKSHVSQLTAAALRGHQLAQYLLRLYHKGLRCANNHDHSASPHQVALSKSD